MHTCAYVIDRARTSVRVYLCACVLDFVRTSICRASVRVFVSAHVCVRMNMHAPACACTCARASIQGARDACL